MRRFAPATDSPVALSVALVLSVLQPLVVLTDVALPGRTWTAVAYALLVPGVPVAAWLRLPSRVATVGIAVAVSISVQILVAMVSSRPPTGHRTRPSSCRP